MLLLVAAVVLQVGFKWDITGKAAAMFSQEPTIATPVPANQPISAAPAAAPVAPAVAVQTCLSIPIGKSGDPVKAIFKDAMDTKTGIPGQTAEVLGMGVNPADPNRVKTDTTYTTASGSAEFTSNQIYSISEYQLVIRGDNSSNLVYDYKTNIKTPCLPSDVRGYTIADERGNLVTYLLKKVGTFKDIYPYTTLTTVAANTITVNVTSGNVTDADGNILYTGLGSTSVQYFELADAAEQLQFGESVSGKLLKMPTITLESVEGREMSPNHIKKLFLKHESGTDFGLGADNKAGNIDSTPLIEVGSFTDTIEGNINYMISSDSGRYSFQVEFDADEVSNSLTAGDSLAFRVAEDDLGGYRAKDSITLGLKATSQEMVVEFVQ